MADDEIIYEIYDEGGIHWWENIPPNYLLAVFILNILIFLIIYTQLEKNPIYFFFEFIISIVLLYLLGSGKSREAENKLKLREALKILHNELRDRVLLEKEWHIHLPDGAWEPGNFDVVRSPHDNKIISYRLGFEISNIKGIKKHFLSEVSADKTDKGYGVGLIGLHSLTSKYKGEFIVYKVIPIKSLQDWKDYQKIKKLGIEY